MDTTHEPSETDRRKAELARAEGQRIQARMDKKAKAREHQENGGQRPMQAGLREYPARFPRQHMKKHGSASQLELEPMYDAPHYAGSGKLAGMVALVTGASSGIGRSIAILFAREGADVAVAYLTNDDDAKATGEAVEREGRRCLLLCGDVADSAFCTNAVEKTARELGRLDILVSNAAFQQHVDDILDLSDEQFDRTMRTNLYGSFYLARAAIPHLRPGGSIIFTGSVVGERGSKELLDYSMTKGGLHTFTRSLAAHLVDRNIRVNCVAPGPVWTTLNVEDRPAEQVETFGADTKMRRAAQPEEIAPAFVFLAAPACSSYITGEVLPVIGGGT